MKRPLTIFNKTVCSYFSNEKERIRILVYHSTYNILLNINFPFFKFFRSQLSVCSEPPAAIRQLSCQSSLEPCFPEENMELDEKLAASEELIPPTDFAKAATEQSTDRLVNNFVCKTTDTQKKSRPDTLPLKGDIDIKNLVNDENKPLYRSNSSRTHNRPKPKISKGNDDSIFYIKSNLKERIDKDGDHYDSLRVINERRSTLLRADSETALAERKLSSFSLVMQNIPEKLVEGSGHTSIEVEEIEQQVELDKNTDEETKIQIEDLEKN